MTEAVRTGPSSPMWGAIRHALLTARVGPLQGGGLWGSIGIVLVYLAIAIPQYGQPYVIDEAVFPYVADGILKHGAPIFYNGETRPMDVGLWHPPLYDYLLALQVFVWGMSPFAVRAFGSLCVVASFLLLALALRRVAPGIKQYGYVVLAALFLLNPLVIGDALVPDIDGTLGLFVVALGLWVATLVAQSHLTPRLVLVVFAFATLAVSTKYIIAAIIAVFIGCAALISPAERWWKALWVVVAFAAGTVISLILLFATGYLVGFDARGPFVYLFGSLGSRAPGRSGLHGALINLAEGPGSNLVWIGPALVVAAVVAAVAVFVARPLAVSRPLMLLFAGGGVAVILGYAYITASPFGFPKYTAIAVASLALAATVLVEVLRTKLPAQSERGAGARITVIVGYIAVLGLGVAGMFWLLSRFAPLQPRLLQNLLAVTVPAFVAVVVVSALVVFILWPAAGRAKRAAVAGVLAAAIITPVMVQLSSSLVDLTSPFATRYYYGERGMAEFLARADDVIPAGAAVIAPKDVGLQLGRPFYEDASFLGLTPSKLRSELARTEAPYLVTRSLWDYSESVFPAQFDVLREFYEPVLVDSALDFTLWKLK
ncbi:MAG: hypothetical protein JWP19_2709 [Rhodoglobus sp.]|nr:hypothetical protein [Rhodoglobus sp.]